MITLDAKLSDLTHEQQQAVKDWRNTVEANGTRVGLWIYGKRRAGSTHIGKVAYNKVLFDHPEWNCQYTTALDLINETREAWGTNDLVSKHPYDDGLWMEATLGEVQLESFWTCELAWIDDWHLFDVDMKFWRRFIQPYIEQRIKQKLPTIVSTQYLPNDPGLVELQRVIEQLFVVVHATR